MLKISFIGIGDYTLDIINVLKTIDNISLSHIFDADLNNAQAFCAKNYRLNLTATTNLENIAIKSNCVFINSLLPTKVDIIKFFLQKNVHVFVIPPVTFAYQQLLELRNIAEANDVFLCDCPFFIDTQWFAQAIEFTIKNNIIGANFYNYNQNNDIDTLNRVVFINKYDYHYGRGVLYADAYNLVYSTVFLFGKVVNLKALGHRLLNKSILDFKAILSHQNQTISSIDVYQTPINDQASLLIGENTAFSLINYNILEEFNVKYNSKKVILSSQTKKDIRQIFMLFIKNLNNNDRLFFNKLLNISIETIRVLALIDNDLEKFGEV